MTYRAIILLGTLKKNEPSNTRVLCEFFEQRAREKDILCEIINLVDHHILPGTYADMGEGDAWPTILQKIESSDIIIVATPIWWGSASSEIQRVIERLDEIHDEILQKKTSRLDGKVGGVIITGDSDGAQHIIGTISNFFNAIGIVIPPFATLSVLWEGHRKDRESGRDNLLKKYKEEYAKAADQMIDQILRYTSQ